MLQFGGYSLTRSLPVAFLLCASWLWSVCRGQTFAGYTPATDVTNSSIIDVDQSAIEQLLSQLIGSSSSKANDDILLQQAYALYLQRLRLLSTDGDVMRDADGEFFPTFALFLEYMGSSDYAHDFVDAGYNGTVTTSGYSGNFNFVVYSLPGGRSQVIQQVPILFSSVQYVIRNLEVAVQQCSVCLGSGTTGVDCGVALVDDAVALYVGSLQDTLSTSDAGYMMYATADRLCQVFDTCDGTLTSTGQLTSRVNAIIMQQFAEMQQNVQQGLCVEASANRDRIKQQIFIPLIQGTIRSSYLNEGGSGSEYCAADVAVYGASILPLIFNCSSSDAKTLYEQTKPSTTLTSGSTVQGLLANSYGCLGISADDVGTFSPDVVVNWGRCGQPTPSPVAAAYPPGVGPTRPGTVVTAAPSLAPVPDVVSMPMLPAKVNTPTSRSFGVFQASSFILSVVISSCFAITLTSFGAI
jgi:hypothetical protein